MGVAVKSQDTLIINELRVTMGDEKNPVLQKRYRLDCTYHYFHHSLWYNPVNFLQGEGLLKDKFY